MHDRVLGPRRARAALSTTASSTGWRSVGERGDHPQDLGRGGLLLQRLGDLAVALLELGVALLQLLEQPGVLDGDDRLVRERLQQRDLASVNGRASKRWQTMSTPMRVARPEAAASRA